MAAVETPHAEYGRRAQNPRDLRQSRQSGPGPEAAGPTRRALKDRPHNAVAATQFTAYMAMANLVIGYTSWWQGLSIVRWGHPVTLALDSALGLVMVFLLPLMAPKRGADHRLTKINAGTGPTP